MSENAKRIDPMELSFLLGGIALILFIFVCLQFWVSQIHERKMARLQKDLDYYSQTYLRKQGATALWQPSKGMVNYELMSFDGGRNWYAIERLNDNLTIKGSAEEIYPGLIKHLSSMDALYDRVNKHGSLNLNDPTDVAFLQGVGFTIQTNK